WMSGAHIYLVKGLISDAGKIVAAGALDQRWFDISTLREPYRVEGKKTMGYEVAEHFNWSLPDVIIYPTGGGTGIIGMWKAFEEMEKLGWIGAHRPRMIAVQSSGCAPIVTAFKKGVATAEVWKDATTIAAGLRVPHALGDFLILQALRSSRGEAVAVEDAEIVRCMKVMAKEEGIFACPEGAATLAGLQHLIADGSVDNNETVVLFNTGSGLKYVELFPLKLPVLNPKNAVHLLQV
ncbi:MAG: threonine synthase, partial [Candidatus Bathyarchaeota archaeon]